MTVCVLKFNHVISIVSMFLPPPPPRSWRAPFKHEVEAISPRGRRDREAGGWGKRDQKGGEERETEGKGVEWEMTVCIWIASFWTRQGQSVYVPYGFGLSGLVHETEAIRKRRGGRIGFL